MIRDFITAVLDAYYKINAKRINAKARIIELTSLSKRYSKFANDLKVIDHSLNENWSYFPIKQRRDYIQKFKDLIKYGNDIQYCGLINIYEYIVAILHESIHRCNDLYKQREYDAIEGKYNATQDEINRILIRYKIIESNDAGKAETVR